MHIIYRQKINQISPAIMSKYKLKFILLFLCKIKLNNNYVYNFFLGFKHFGNFKLHCSFLNCITGMFKYFIK